MRKLEAQVARMTRAERGDVPSRAAIAASARDVDPWRRPLFDGVNQAQPLADPRPMQAWYTS